MYSSCSPKIYVSTKKIVPSRVHYDLRAVRTRVPISSTTISTLFFSCIFEHQANRVFRKSPQRCERVVRSFFRGGRDPLQHQRYCCWRPVCVDFILPYCRRIYYLVPASPWSTYIRSLANALKPYLRTSQRGQALSSNFFWINRFVDPVR